MHMASMRELRDNDPSTPAIILYDPCSFQLQFLLLPRLANTKLSTKTALPGWVNNFSVDYSVYYLRFLSTYMYYIIQGHSEQVFLTKELDKHKLHREDRRLLYATLGGFFLVLCSRQVRLLTLRSSLRSVCTLLVCENKNDKFYFIFECAHLKLQ